MSQTQSHEKIRVLFWATTFGADMHSFARYLDNHPDYSIMNAMHNPDSFRKEGIQELHPITSPMFDRESKLTFLRLLVFKPHILITDNHFPPLRFAKKLLVLWHGYGWRKDNMVGEFEAVHNNITRLVGDGRVPNPNFGWQCYGAPDVEYRHMVSGFSMENLHDIGFAQADDLLNPPVSREQAAPYYSIDIQARPTVLMAFTWHHGRILAHWGEDADLFQHLFALADRLEINLLFRMHDRFRYSPEYHSHLDSLMRGRDNVMIKFKDEYPDNLLDMIVSDVMVSNYSSILNRFYVTGRPTIHIYPDRKEDEIQNWKKLGKDGTLVEQHVDDVSDAWKHPAEWHGGLMVHTYEEFVQALEQALEDPDCCRVKATEFIRDGITGVDGRTCERTENVLRSMVLE
jgi:hypothetical protein